MADDDLIVPFGKYKGQLLRAVIGDRGYWQWAMLQPFLVEAYREIFEVVSNGGVGHSETPEHNRIQARFLEPKFCRRVLKLCGLKAERGPEVHFEYEGLWHNSGLIPKHQRLRAERMIGKGVFVLRSIDVLLVGIDGVLLIEIKPSLGDDFPAVLRQARDKHCNVVAYERFQVSNLSIEQVRTMFGDIQLVCVSGL